MDTSLVIFGGKTRSCEKSVGPVNCSVHRTLCPVTLGEFSLTLLEYHVMKTKQSVTCVQLYIVFYSGLCIIENKWLKTFFVVFSFIMCSDCDNFQIYMNEIKDVLMGNILI